MVKLLIARGFTEETAKDIEETAIGEAYHMALKGKPWFESMVTVAARMGMRAQNAVAHINHKRNTTEG